MHIKYFEAKITNNFRRVLTVPVSCDESDYDVEAKYLVGQVFRINVCEGFYGLQSFLAINLLSALNNHLNSNTKRKHIATRIQ